MPATVQLQSWHGAAPGSGTDKSGATVRFKNADDDTQNTSDYLTIPSADYAYSYLKNLRLKCTVTPASLIDNLKFYSDGIAFGTGLQVMGKKSATYVDPVANAANALAGTSDIVAYTVGAPLALDGSLANPNTGDFGDFVVLQLKVAPTPAPGVGGGRTITFRWDEI
jgi:hypothetical protein